jgi:hypothetical protein
MGCNGVEFWDVGVLDFIWVEFLFVQFSPDNYIDLVKETTTIGSRTSPAEFLN